MNNEVLKKNEWIIPIQEQAKNIEIINPHEKIDVLKDQSLLRPAQYLRRVFIITKKVKYAYLYITSRGLYRFYVNGIADQNNILSPELTPFNKEITYQKYNILSSLKKGKNVLGVILTDGWHISRIGLIGQGCQYAHSLALNCHIEIEYEDTTTDTIASDEEFCSTQGPIVYSDLFIGEKYDARKDLGNWMDAFYDNASWKKVTRGYYKENLVLQSIEPVKKDEYFQGKLLRREHGIYLYDFGQVIAGRVILQCVGKKGTTVIIEHSEVVDYQNNFIKNITGHNKDQKDIYICNGKGKETYEPIGTYHGFRYVMIYGDIEIIQIQAYSIRTMNQQSIQFECSNKQINQLWKNIDCSIKSNTISIPTDCPQRERAGYTGDAQIIMETLCWFYDVKNFMNSWLHSLRLEQYDNGQVPTIVPNYPSMSRFIKRHDGFDTSIGWGDAVVIVPWVLYQYYGDVSILKDNYRAMKKWLEFVKRWASNGNPFQMNIKDKKGFHRYILDEGFSFGDWLIPSFSKGVENPMEHTEKTKGPINTAYFAYVSLLMALIANELNYQKEHEEYTKLYHKIKKAFIKEYYLDKGLFTYDFQGIYVVALAFDLLPSKKDQKYVVDRLVKKIKDNHDCLDTGFLSTKYLLPVLSQYGYPDVAYHLLFQEKCPSWLYEVNHGATTIWESWNAIDEKGNIHPSSFNHYAYGCVGDWIVRNVVGISSFSPGFKALEIKPIFSKKLDYVKCSYQTRYGQIFVQWKKTKEGIIIDLQIPKRIKGIFKYNGKTLRLKEKQQLHLTYEEVSFY